MGDNTTISHPLLEVEKLKKEAKQAQKRREKEKVHCPDCGTTLWKDTLSEAVSTAETHDEKRHGGDTVTKINGITPPSFSENEKENLREAVESFQTE